MDKLELIEQFKKRYTNKLNPLMYSFKYCQSDFEAFVEVSFHNNPTPFILNLKFIGGEIVEDENGNDVDIIPMFIPNNDIVDNASRFINLSDYELLVFIDNFFTETFAHEIHEIFKKSLPNNESIIDKH